LKGKGGQGLGETMPDRDASRKSKSKTNKKNERQLQIRTHGQQGQTQQAEGEREWIQFLQRQSAARLGAVMAAAAHAA
jgi:hypothetical protein